MNEVQIREGDAVLSGNLTIPENAVGLVLFAHRFNMGLLADRLLHDGCGCLASARL